jgi:ribosomal protein S18 acetylase RimI-like enzyme
MAEILARRASASDRTAIALALAAAHENDPVMKFIFPNFDVRIRRLPRFYEVLFDCDMAAGACYVTNSGEAATLWRAPGAERLSFREKAQQSLSWLDACGTALGRTLAVSVQSDANHPGEPHWHLQVAGCAPVMQGKGFGTAAIRAGIAQADRDQIPCYLDTTAGNIGFYQRLGFSVIKSWKISGGGPENWSMIRAAGRSPA